MSIASRITEINSHLLDDYSVLSVAGADLTNVDKNIVNLKETWQERLLYFMNNGTDIVWNNWNKATGSGTEISLNNTLEAKMGIKLKGNTYQYSTTGKNLLGYTLASLKSDNTSGTWSGNVYTYNGVTFTINDDMTIKVNGTASSQTNFWLNMDTNLANGNYILNGCPSNGSANTYMISLTKVLAPTNVVETGSGENVVVSDSNTYSSIRIVVQSGKTVNNLTFKPMIRLSSITDDTYEPYTNGASPNPDYPQDIHVVSGDNSVKIEGKNLLDIYNHKDTSRTFLTFNQDSSVVINGSVNTNNFDLILQTNPLQLKAGTYTFSSNFDFSDSNIRMWLRSIVNGTPTTSVLVSNYTGNLSANFTISEPTNVYLYITGLNGKTIDNFTIRAMIRSSSIQDSTYEPYQSQTYPINLGVANLVNFSDGSDTINNISVMRHNQEIKLNQTATSGTYSWLIITKDSFNLHSNTPTASNIVSYANGKTISTGIVSRNINVLSGTSTLSLTGFNIYDETGTAITTLTSTTNVIAVGIYLGNGQTFNNFTFKVELTEGSTPQYVSENPIELCKIGTYQDTFIRNSGNNLFDLKKYFDDRSATYTLNNDGSITYANQSVLYNTPFVFSDTDINVSVSGVLKNITATSARVQLLNSSNSVVGYLNETTAKVENVQACKLRLDWSNNGTMNIKNVMLNLGTTALPYEPYGNGEWYLKKEIMGMSLVSNWWVLYNQSGQAPRRFGLSGTKYFANGLPLMCNCFVAGSYNSQVDLSIWTQTGYLAITDKNSHWETANDLMTWINNNDTRLLYPLATPTYTKITGTLETQLNALELARSYNEQTNLSQTNNDKPFILDAMALEEW